jgi:streptomycin 6-kinase
VLGRDIRSLTDEFLRWPPARLPAGTGPLRRSDFDAARVERDRLLAAGSRQVLLHGDLHLNNVLHGADGPVVIDPKSCVGDPCFDAIDYVLAGAGRHGTDATDGVDARITALAEAGLDVDRLPAWCRMAAPAVVAGLLRRGGSDRAVEELLALTR